MNYQSSQSIAAYFFSDSHGQVRQLPCHMQSGEDTDPLQINEVSSALPPITTRQQTNSTSSESRKREHTAPKVLLSILHKILYWNPDTTKLFEELLSDVNRKVNNSTPVKFYLLASRAGLLSVLKERFPQEAEDKLNEYFQKKNWTENRLLFGLFCRMATAKLWKRRIERALKERSCKKVFDVIWEGNNHPGRYSASEKQVESFKKRISKMRKSQLIKFK